MSDLEVGDAVRLIGGDPARSGRILGFVEEEMERYALVAWDDQTRTAHPVDDLARI
jgi:hypothetical protein